MDNKEIKSIVLDFDGTICKLFKNYNLKNKVIEMHNVMKTFGIDFPITLDIFDIFAVISQQQTNIKHRDDISEFAHKFITSIESEAVDNIEIVSGFLDVIPKLISAGYKIGICSNNSYECIKKFLDRYLPNIKIPIIGRIPRKPELMKPNSWPLKEILQVMKCCDSETIFIGDTKNDFDCCVKTNCSFIGMAINDLKFNKLSKFLSTENIIFDYYDLIKILEK